MGVLGRGGVRRAALGVALVGAAFACAPGTAGASTFTVNSLGDDLTDNTACTFREALESARTNGSFFRDECGSSTGQAFPFIDGIVFSVGTGTPTINVGSSALPQISDAIQIFGNIGDANRIRLNGSGALGNALTVTSTHSLIQGLVISNFPGNGIAISGGGTNTIQGNLIGTGADGTSDQGNNSDGIAINNSNGNLIGGTTAFQRNVISGNSASGVEIGGAVSANDNIVTGNYVGVDVNSAALPNGQEGVAVHHGTGNRVGGTTGADTGGPCAGECNVVSGNAFSGVVINGPDATSNSVVGNHIGTDNLGTHAVPNRTGVDIRVGSSGNTVGGTAISARNVIAGNSQTGVRIDGNSGSAGNNVVQGNFIGLATDGLFMGNGEDGVRVLDSSGNSIGGAVAGARNVISASSNDGVEIAGAGSAANVVAGNYIGTDPTGAVSRPNAGAGVRVTGAPGVTVGGTTDVTPGGACTGACNLISGNSSRGVVLGAGSSGASVLGNLIGLSAAGTAAVGNGLGGIRAEAGSTGHTIGGTTPAARNTISGNNGPGVDLSGTGTGVVGNLFGKTADGVTDLFNASMGVLIDGGSQNTVGGDSGESENQFFGPGGIGVANGGAGNVFARNRGVTNLGGPPFIDLAPPVGAGTDGTSQGGAVPPVFLGAGGVAAHGTAAPGSVVRLFQTNTADGAAPLDIQGFIGSVTTNAAGQWTLTYSAPLAAGVRVTATQTPAGGTSEFANVRTVENTPPDTVIVSGPTDGSTIATRTPAFGFTSEAGATFECAVDGGAFAPCSSVHTVAALADGQHTFRVRAIDTNLNVDPTPATRTFIVDTAAPDTVITTAPRALSNDATPTVAFRSSEAGARFECRLDAGAFAACTSPHTRPVTAGRHTISVRAVDPSGNADATPAVTTFTVDLTRPVVSRFNARNPIFRVATGQTPVTRQRPRPRRRGTTFRFRLSERATVRIVVERKLPGRRVNGRCVRRTRANARRPRCTRFVRRGTLTRRNLAAGNRSVAFTGRIGRVALPAGSYRASLTARDVAGNVSRVVRTNFRIVR